MNVLMSILMKFLMNQMNKKMIFFGLGHSKHSKRRGALNGINLSFSDSWCVKRFTYQFVSHFPFVCLASNKHGDAWWKIGLVCRERYVICVSRIRAAVCVCQLAQPAARRQRSSVRTMHRMCTTTHGYATRNRSRARTRCWREPRPLRLVATQRFAVHVQRPAGRAA